MGDTQLDKLQKAQNMRVILQCDIRTIKSMLEALQFMSIKQRLYYNVCTFKILRKIMPEHLRNRLEIMNSGEKDKQDRQEIL